MPLVMNLDPSNPAPSISQRNANSSLAITTSNDTVTINANPNFPRIVMFRPTVATSITIGRSDAVKFPISADAAQHMQISGTTVFNVSADSSSGTLHVWVVQ